MAAKSNDTPATHSDAEGPLQFIDWRGGEGIKQKEVDEQKLQEHTLLMRNCTLFRPNEGVAPLLDKRLWFRLDKHNRDTWGQYRVDTDVNGSKHQEYKLRLIKLISSKVGLTSVQRTRAFRWLMKLDLQLLGQHTTLVAFTVCAIIWNEDAKSSSAKSYHPQRKPANNPEAFHQFAEHLKETHPQITKSSLTSMYNKLYQDDPALRSPETWKPYFRNRDITAQDHDGQIEVWNLNDIEREENI